MSRKGENITKRKDGRWEARVICGYDEHHHAQYRYLYGKTYAEAKAKKEYLRADIIQCRGGRIPSAHTVESLAAEFLQHKKTTVKPSTWTHYRYLLATYIPPHMAHMPLARLTTTCIERYALELLQSGGRKQGGLSPKTVRDILGLLRSVLGYGAKRRYLSAEILDFASPAYVPPKTAVLARDEQTVLERFATENADSFRLGLCLALYTGLRLGELCALRWSDVNLVGAELSVHRTIRRIPSENAAKTEILISSPKTRSGVRTIPIPSCLTEYLTAQKSRALQDDAYLLTGKDTYIEPANYYMKYKRWLKKLGLPRYSFHALRHTFATRCIESGFDVKTLSEILGHADVRITLNRYVHPSMELKHRQMEKLCAVYAPSRRDIGTNARPDAVSTT